MTSRKQLVVNADDFGFTEDVNEGIVQAHRDGILPATTLMANGAAFDDAVLQLQDHDPMWDEGPFSQLAVTGRQWSAASALSNDSLAIDSRLDRIRLQVELALAPPDPPLPPPSLGVAPTGDIDTFNEAVVDPAENSVAEDNFVVRQAQSAPPGREN